MEKDNCSIGILQAELEEKIERDSQMSREYNDRTSRLGDEGSIVFLEKLIELENVGITSEQVREILYQNNDMSMKDILEMQLEKYEKDISEIKKF